VEDNHMSSPSNCVEGQENVTGFGLALAVTEGLAVATGLEGEMGLGVTGGLVFGGKYSVSAQLG
jgi:hypothetical protein